MFKKKSIDQQVLHCLATAIEPATFGKLTVQQRVSIEATQAVIAISLPFYAPQWLAAVQQQTLAALTRIFDRAPTWQVTHDVPMFEHKKVAKVNAKIRNIIVVSSGKGGVGKSTVSVNLALALAKNGAQVGMLDADIYGPSLPTMLGQKKTKSTTADGKLLQPIEAHGIVCNSIGFLIDDKAAMVWRGPMASKALQQVLHETDWPALDYLVVDMPPGTGDIQLTMSQNVPLTSALVVTTPQDIALVDAQKGVVMFDKVDVNVAGIIENMSVHACAKCGHEEAIFGTGGGEKLAAQFNLPFLGALPLHIQYREDSDAGQPTVAKDETAALIAPYLQLAEKVAMNLYQDLVPALAPIDIKEVK